ncbi:hypothetical protein ACFIJ5_14520 [Haloimpatiens sp. FM7330]|uniref:hypothetical protein n=1 Tax=Haloimpatiens sp. FM7330 TaxID=3298610 RepID=UPI0036310A6C
MDGALKEIIGFLVILISVVIGIFISEARRRDNIKWLLGLLCISFTGFFILIS